MILFDSKKILASISFARLEIAGKRASFSWKKYSTVERNVSFVVVGEPAFKRELSFLALRNLLNARLRRAANDAAGRSVGWLLIQRRCDPYSLPRYTYTLVSLLFSFTTNLPYKRASKFTPTLNLSFIDLKKHSLCYFWIQTCKFLFLFTALESLSIKLYFEKIKIYQEDN